MIASPPAGGRGKALPSDAVRAASLRVGRTPAMCWMPPGRRHAAAADYANDCIIIASAHRAAPRVMNAAAHAIRRRDKSVSGERGADVVCNQHKSRSSNFTARSLSVSLSRHDADAKCASGHSDTSALFTPVRSVRTFRHQYRSVSVPNYLGSDVS